MPAQHRHRDRPTVKQRRAERRSAGSALPTYPDLDPMASVADAFEYQERVYRDHTHCSCGPPWCCRENCPGWTPEDETAYGY